MIPVSAGIKMDSKAHLLLPVSFFMVKTVVKHGQCIKANNITQIAVNVVHPLSINNVFNDDRLSKSVI